MSRAGFRTALVAGAHCLYSSRLLRYILFFYLYIIYSIPYSILLSFLQPIILHIVQTPSHLSLTYRLRVSSITYISLIPIFTTVDIYLRNLYIYTVVLNVPTENIYLRYSVLRDLWPLHLLRIFMI
jgi:hypothetical protein